MQSFEYFIPLVGFVVLYVITLILAYAFVVDDRFKDGANWTDFATGPAVIGGISIFISGVVAINSENLIMVEYIIGVLNIIGMNAGVVLGAVSGYNLRHGRR